MGALSDFFKKIFAIKPATPVVTPMHVPPVVQAPGPDAPPAPAPVVEEAKAEIKAEVERVVNKPAKITGKPKKEAAPKAPKAPRAAKATKTTKKVK